MLSAADQQPAYTYIHEVDNIHIEKSKFNMKISKICDHYKTLSKNIIIAIATMKAYGRTIGCMLRKDTRATADELRIFSSASVSESFLKNSTVFSGALEK